MSKNTNSRLPMAEYTLIDGVLRNYENPDTFEIPTLEERQGALEGDLVKVGFECKGEDMGGERMWVEIDTAENGHYTGTIANHPFVIPNLRFGDEVTFSSKHIISIY